MIPNRTHMHRDDGFSAPELLIASVIGLIVLGLAYLIFETSLRQFNRVDAFTQQSRAAAQVVGRISKPLREASHLDVADDYEIQFDADWNDDGSLEVLDYSPPAGSNSMLLAITKGGATTTQTLASNVVNRSLVANFLPAPTLTAVRQPGVIVLTWPTNFPGYTLQQNTDLNTANWVAALETVSPAGTNYQSTIQTTNGPRFFRLQHP